MNDKFNNFLQALEDTYGVGRYILYINIKESVIELSGDYELAGFKRYDIISYQYSESTRRYIFKGPRKFRVTVICHH